MTFTAAKLYSLLPAIYRIRDLEHGNVLRELIGCLAEQVNAIEEDIDQLYDDLFIETCAPWVIPYIGEIVGYRQTGVSPSRQEVADLIDFRRRKGTADALEDIAAAETKRSVVVVEFFRRLATTQYLNHLRPRNLVTPNLRDIDTLIWRNSPFDLSARTVQVGRAASGRGKYNIPNLGIFIWRTENFSMREATPFQVDPRRFFFSPLGANTALFVNPEAEAPGQVLEERTSVPQPVFRRAAFLSPGFYYGQERSFWVEQTNTLIPLSQVKICDLSDTGADPQTSAWGNMPASGVAIDPELGRLAFSSDVDTATTPVNVSFSYGFHSRIGGGEYDRSENLIPAAGVRQVPRVHATVAAAVTAAAGNGVVEISGSGRYQEALAITAVASGALEIRAADRSRPTLVLTTELVITAGDSSTVTLNGLTFAGAPIRVPATARLQKLRLVDCTLVPGISLRRDGRPAQAGKPSLIVEAPDVEIEIERCILGPLQVETDSRTSLVDSIVDASSRENPACAGIGGEPGGPVSAEAVTIIGTIHTLRLEMGSNSIFLGLIRAEHVQKGCVRYSYLQPASRSPRRYLCQPSVSADVLRDRPRFVSLRYGQPGYAQLDRLTTTAIRQGADDGGEMGVGHSLLEAAREQALCRTLDEFVPLGMEAGLFSAGDLRIGRIS